jgi:hypothetical protein
VVEIKPWMKDSKMRQVEARRALVGRRICGSMQ